MLFVFLGVILVTLILGWLRIIPRFLAGGLLVIFIFGVIGWAGHQICLVSGMSLKSVFLLGVLGVASFLR